MDIPITLDERIRAAGIKLTVRTATSRSVNPNIGKKEWAGAFHYSVTLKNIHGRTMRVPFSCGSGWTREPNAEDVLECLLSDAGCILSLGDRPQPKEFLAEFGYPSTRPYVDLFWRMVKQTRALAEFLQDDPDGLNAWVSETEMP